MGRPHRIDHPGGWYHVVNRGAARQDIFLDDRDRIEFQRLLGVAHDRLGLTVHAFCQMTNHYHLLVECPDGGLSDAMQMIGSVYVRHFNERHGRDGPLFRDRFYAKPVMSDAYLVRLVRYIHRNPLAIAGVDDPRTFRWSSLRIHAGDRRSPPWMRTDVVLALFGGVEQLLRSTSDEPGRLDAALDAPMEAAEWLAAIDLMLDEHAPATSRQGAARTLGALLLDRVSGGDRSSLEEALGFPSGGAARMARSRARRRASDTPELLAIADDVLRLIA